MTDVTIDSLIDGLGGTKSVSDGLGLPPSTVSTWRARGFIPAKRWSEVVRIASEKGCEGVTFEALAALAAAAACGPAEAACS